MKRARREPDLSPHFFGAVVIVLCTHGGTSTMNSLVEVSGPEPLLLRFKERLHLPTSDFWYSERDSLNLRFNEGINQPVALSAFGYPLLKTLSEAESPGED